MGVGLEGMATPPVSQDSGELSRPTVSQGAQLESSLHKGLRKSPAYSTQMQSTRTTSSYLNIKVTDTHLHTPRVSIYLLSTHHVPTLL